MTPATSHLTPGLDILTLQCLGDGVDTPRLDEYLAHLFAIATMGGWLTCECLEGRIQVKAGSIQLFSAEVPRAKTKVRLLCARLEKRAADASGGRLTAAEGARTFTLGEHSYFITVINSTNVQQISIKATESNENGHPK